MRVSDYPIDNIHLPSHSLSVRLARIISIVGGIVIALAAVTIFLTWIFKINFLSDFFGYTLINIPMIIAFAGCSVTIFFYSSLELKKIYFVCLGVVNIIIGLATVFEYFFPYFSIFSLLSIHDIKAGIILALLGYSLLISVSRINNRFHYTQIILFIASFLSLYGILKIVYQFTATGNVLSGGENSAVSSLLFFILCQSFLFIKANRGFLALFTTDTNSSELARFSLISFLVLPPLLGILILLEEKVGFLDNSGRLSLLIATQMLLSVIITWINEKMLYPSEVKNYLTGEALRVNNITLELNKSDLSQEVNKLEEDKENAINKLNNKETLMDYVDKLE